MLFHKNKINKAYEFIREIGFPVVIKLFDGAHGDLVFIGLKNRKECDEAIKNSAEVYRFLQFGQV